MPGWFALVVTVTLCPGAISLDAFVFDAEDQSALHELPWNSAAKEPLRKSCKELGDIEEALESLGLHAEGRLKGAIDCRLGGGGRR